MDEWKDMIIERLEAAYRVRFERDQAIIFLNDAYQNILFLKMMSAKDDDQICRNFIKEFMGIRDFFISQLIDHYVCNYKEVEDKIKQFHQVYLE